MLSFSPHLRKTASPWRRTVCDILKPVLTDAKKNSAKLKIGGETTLLVFFSANTTSGFAKFVLAFYISLGLQLFALYCLTKWSQNDGFPTGVRSCRARNPLGLGKKRHETRGLKKNGTKALGPQIHGLSRTRVEKSDAKALGL